MYERFLNEQFKPFVEKFFSGFVAAYRERYSCNHVLMQLIENWKRAIDENFKINTVLKDLLKAFDCIPHVLLIIKLYAYGLSVETTLFFYSYLKRRGQRVKIDTILSSWQVLISGVLQGSILDPILFIFLNNLLQVLKNSHICNLADDNTISVASTQLLWLEMTLFSKKTSQ